MSTSNAPRVNKSYRGARRNHYRNVGAMDRWRDHEGVIHAVKQEYIGRPARRGHVVHDAVRPNRSRKWDKPSPADSAHVQSKLEEYKRAVGK